MTEPPESDWTISPASARFDCATSIGLPIFVTISAIGIAGALISTAIIDPSVSSILLGIVGGLIGLISVYLNSRVRLTLTGETLHITNRLASYTIALADIEKVAVSLLVRNGKGPPCIRLQVAGQHRLVQLAATAALSRAEREEIAERFAELGLKPSQSYLNW